MANRALFLDRDGVINVDSGYVHTLEAFHFIEGIFDLCREARRLGYLVIVATNQAGIARGFYSESDFARLTTWMMGRFVREDCPLSAVYYCPFHPESGLGPYRVDSFDRKPKPGMLLRARNEFGIDMRRSVLVGDKDADLVAGRSAGVGTNVLYSARPDQGGLERPDLVVGSLIGLGRLLRSFTR
jgi:D-glycero-D-manno-heptose 1,7-bisphosphate phosphatase